MDLKTAVKTAAAYKGITMGQVSARMGASQQALGQRLKTGRFTLDELQALAQACGAEMDMTWTFPDGFTIRLISPEDRTV